MCEPVRLVLVRHGESQWNRENRFTGWADVDMTDEGVIQMRAAGVALRNTGVTIDVAYSSVLVRCIRSLWILLEEIECPWVPQMLDWRLNERHYGALTGRSKVEAEMLYGAAAVHAWRRSYDVQPPASDARSNLPFTSDRRYAELTPAEMPVGESLEQTVVRVDRFWETALARMLCEGKSAVVVGHGNSLRALIKIIECLSNDDVAQLEIANGSALTYEFDAALSVVGKCSVAVGSSSRSQIL